MFAFWVVALFSCDSSEAVARDEGSEGQRGEQSGDLARVSGVRGGVNRRAKSERKFSPFPSFLVAFASRKLARNRFEAKSPLEITKSLLTNF